MAGLTVEYVNEIVTQVGGIWQSFNVKQKGKSFADNVHLLANIFSADVDYTDKCAGAGGRQLRGIKQVQAFWTEKASMEKNVVWKLSRNQTMVDTDKMWACVEWTVSLEEEGEPVKLTSMARIKFHEDGRIKFMTIYNNVIGEQPGAQKMNVKSVFQALKKNSGNNANTKSNPKRQRDLTDEQIQAKREKSEKYKAKKLEENPDWDICFAFQKAGACKAGEKCKWRHCQPINPVENAAAPNPDAMED